MAEKATPDYQQSSSGQSSEINQEVLPKAAEPSSLPDVVKGIISISAHI